MNSNEILSQEEVDVLLMNMSLGELANFVPPKIFKVSVKKINSRISFILKVVRKYFNWTLEDMAKYLDSYPTLIEQWENGEIPMDAAAYVRLNKVMENRGIICDLAETEFNITISDF